MHKGDAHLLDSVEGPYHPNIERSRTEYFWKKKEDKERMLVEKAYKYYQEECFETSLPERRSSRSEKVCPVRAKTNCRTTWMVFGTPSSNHEKCMKHIAISHRERFRKRKRHVHHAFDNAFSKQTLRISKPNQLLAEEEVKREDGSQEGGSQEVPKRARITHDLTASQH
ncbi:hypothetical protein ACROYT_G013846 [Oculina patagonica]